MADYFEDFEPPSKILIYAPTVPVQMAYLLIFMLSIIITLLLRQNTSNIFQTIWKFLLE